MSNISARHSLLKRQSALQLRLATLDVDLHSAAGYSAKKAGNDTLAISASKTACELVQIERVLDKLGRDQYGRCEACGRPIGGERLKVVPNAATCIGCAQGH